MYRYIPLQAHLWGLNGHTMGAEWAAGVCLFGVTQEHTGLSWLLLAGYQAGLQTLSFVWRDFEDTTLLRPFPQPISSAQPIPVLKFPWWACSRQAALETFLPWRSVSASQGAVPGSALACGHPGRFGASPSAPICPVLPACWHQPGIGVCSRFSPKESPHPPSWG